MPFMHRCHYIRQQIKGHFLTNAGIWGVQYICTLATTVDATLHYPCVKNGSSVVPFHALRGKKTPMNSTLALMHQMVKSAIIQFSQVFLASHHSNTYHLVHVLHYITKKC